MSNEEAARIAALADDAYAAGDLPSTERYAAEALTLNPREASALVLMGFVFAQKGAPDEAIRYLFQAIEIDKTLWGPRIALCQLLRSRRRSGEAVDVWKEVINLKPNEAEGWTGLGFTFLELGSLADAGAMFAMAAKQNENDPTAKVGEGLVLERFGLTQKAFDLYASAIKLVPGEPMASQRLVALKSVSLSKTPKAPIRSEATTSEGYFWLAKLQHEVRDMDIAEASYRKSLSIDPEAAEVKGALGLMLMQNGRFDEGGLELEEAIRLQPKWAQLYSMLVSGRKIRTSDVALLQQMESVLKQTVNVDDRIKLHGGLAKAYADIKEFATAMNHSDNAHSLAEEQLQSIGAGFNREEYLAAIEEALTEFNRSNMLDWARKGDATKYPICIVGMIRSGTTLTEQILSSHRDIGGAGELLYWFDRLSEYRVRYMGSPDKVPVEELGAGYRNLLNAFAPGKTRVTDKQPENYWFMPLIYGCLPGTKFVHCRRNPVDTCLSIYTTHNMQGPNWTHTKENIVFVYRQYLRIMEAYKSVLPREAIMEVQYERMVDDRERELPRLIEWLGLPWDPSVLEHEKHVGSITTPSMWQARQPIYRSSVEKWRDYEGLLGTFAELI